MRHAPILLAALVLVGALRGALFPTEAIAQRTPGTKEGGARKGAKPGEVVAPADRSERWSDRLQVGGAAPEFTLPLLAEGETVSLRKLRAQRPVVLIFGSITCPPFRGQLDGIDQVYEQFKDQAEFLFVYIREAHPGSVLSVAEPDGQESLLKIRQATDLPTRTTSAAYCQRTTKLSLPIAVDQIDNSVEMAYAGWPNRMVVVGTDGNILYASSPSPGGTNARRLRTWLEANLENSK